MITSEDFTYTKFNFPGGEMHIKVDISSVKAPAVSLTWNFERNDELVELLLLVDALWRLNLPVLNLVIPYVPFGRQDRVAVLGECFSLKVFADVINSLNIPNVIITDPHSDVTTALLRNVRVITQAEVFAPMLQQKMLPSDGVPTYWLISPDAGAQKKIYSLAAQTHPFGVVECTKKRDVATGSISGVIAHVDDLLGKDCYIVDDICDGGKTFTEIAKVLKTRNPGKIILCVTHGLFTKGLGVFDGLIDEIYTSKGRVK
jgi:ribose-phosphate pyrophosphokinase